MSEIRLNINGREVRGWEGQTVLDIARENGIDIPTMCQDDRVAMYGSCGMCVVEAEGNPKLVRSCSTYAADGMIIRTETKRVQQSRKIALELLLSDHVGDCRPPCVLACPAQTDCQGYAGLIANGEYGEAIKLVKDKIPLPGSIGRVCPHPCETACRRQHVEEPVSIAALKAFVADADMATGELYTPEIAPDTGKSVAVIGGGPGGLTAAYFLRSYGHEVTVYDAMPNMGGMLRYGIPEYRLPKEYLQTEIDAVESMGISMVNNVKIGRDVTLDYMRNNYDAVIVAVGAWTSTGLRCKGEELDGVVGGIDFLREVATGQPVLTGRKIAVVGGGNTAMDACRTAVRLGADKVYNIYRRTKNEMPAEEIEITEAEEEGVIFKNLTNPNEVVGENGKVKAVRLQVMELGEADASGRRAPVPVEGKEETIEVDTVIVAIGQKLDPVGLEGIDLTKRGTIAADEHTFRTSLPGVYAIGDATNKGADIAIAAIGEAKKAAIIVSRYLDGEETKYEEPFVVTSEPDEESYAVHEKQPRAKMPHRSADERRHDFLEVNYGLSEEQAVCEAARCLECGCHDYFECKLVDYANRYKVQPQRLEGKVHHRKHEDDHPFISRNPDKCILCGLCVRICDEVVGASALGLLDRGFDTIVKPALEMPLKNTDCISCGQCVTVCPTGALTETMMIAKQVPTREECTDTVCAFCSVGCQTRLTHTGDLVKRSLPVNEDERRGLLCMKGRFGFGELEKLDRLDMPLIRTDGKLLEADWTDSFVFINKHLQALQTQYGKDSIAVSISGRYTNEEMLLIKEYANKALHTENVFSMGKVPSGLACTLGADASTADFRELETTGLIMLVNVDIRTPHAVAGLFVIDAVKHGAELIALNGFDSAADEYASIKADPGEDLSMLRQILKAVTELSQAGKELEGYAELTASLADLAVSDEARTIAQAYTKSKKAVIVFEQNKLTADAAKLIADIALCAGHAAAPRSGILRLLPDANSQGLADLDIKDGFALCEAVHEGTIKGLFVFGEDYTGMPLDKLEFLAVQDLQITATADLADAVLPAQSYTEVEGTFTNAVGTRQALSPAVADFMELSNFDMLTELSRLMGYEMPYYDISDVTAVLPDTKRGQSPRLCLPSGNELVQEIGTTNALHNSLMAYAKEQGL